MIIECLHCDAEIECLCGGFGSATGCALDCPLRLFLAGNSHDGAGARGEYDDGIRDFDYPDDDPGFDPMFLL